MTVPPSLPRQISDLVPRRWEASLHLGFGLRGQKTVMVDNRHRGPLRVQRPFYPEANGCCHVYLLHPPGGLVLGDQLDITIDLAERSHALVTTPSAGKIYGVKADLAQQRQNIYLHVANDAVVEWLPPETIVFDGANGRLHTSLQLQPGARAIVWDIVCLGRPAAQEVFNTGRCDQTIEVRSGKRLLLLERNRFSGGDESMREPWGMWNATTAGTFLATLSASQMLVDDLRQELNALDEANKHRWGVTRKDELLIIRYLGPSVRICRKGFERAWQMIRPWVNNQAVVRPRIWNT